MARRRRSGKGRSECLASCYGAGLTAFYAQRDETLEQVAPLLDALGFPKNVRNSLYETFAKLDRSHDGLISFDEFCDFFDLEETKFAHRSFLVLDEGLSGTLNFPSFIICAWNYCTYDKRGLAAFAFRLYDEDGHGKIPEEKIMDIVMEIYDISSENSSMADYGIDLRKNTPEYILQKTKNIVKEAVGADSAMDVNEFVSFSSKNPMVLKNAYIIQVRLQVEIISVEFWKEMTRKRRLAEHILNRRVNFLEINEVISALQHFNILFSIADTHGMERKRKTQRRLKKEKLKLKYKRKLEKQKQARQYLERSDSALTIQRAERGRQARRKVKQKMLKRTNSAKKIQALARGRQTRKSSPLNRKRLEKQMKLDLNGLRTTNDKISSRRSKRSSRTPTHRSSLNYTSSRRTSRASEGSVSQRSSRGSSRSKEKSYVVKLTNTNALSARSNHSSRTTSRGNSARSLSGRRSARSNRSKVGIGCEHTQTSSVQSTLQRIDSVSLLNQNSPSPFKDEVPRALRTDKYVYQS